MTNKQKKALSLLSTYTAGSFNFWQLAGSSKASCRAHIMSVLKGKKVPQSKSGVNALQSAFYEFATIEDGCEAVRENSFTKWAKSQNNA